MRNTHPLFGLLALYGTIAFLTWSPHLTALFIAVLAWSLWAGTCVLIDKINVWRAKQVECVHGVRGGQALGRCSICESEKRLADLKEEENRIEEKKARERAEEIKQKARRVNRSEALRLTNSLVPSISDLRNLTSHGFEDVIASMFRRLGYEVEQTPYSNDMGRDAILKRNGEKFLVECKKYNEDGLTGRPDLQKFHSALISDKAVKGFFVTTGGFSRQAVEFARGASIELIDPIRLGKMMYESKRTPASEDSYRVVCSACGETVLHSLRSPTALTCINGHKVSPTLTLEDIFEDFGKLTPKCVICGLRMRIVEGRRGRYWGCSQYPRCRSSQRIERE